MALPVYLILKPFFALSYTSMRPNNSIRTHNLSEYPVIQGAPFLQESNGHRWVVERIPWLLVSEMSLSSPSKSAMVLLCCIICWSNTAAKPSAPKTPISKLFMFDALTESLPEWLPESPRQQYGLSIVLFCMIHSTRSPPPLRIYMQRLNITPFDLQTVVSARATTSLSLSTKLILLTVPETVSPHKYF